MPAAGTHRLEIGRIGRPHGLRGEVTAMMVSDRPERTAPGAVVYAETAAGPDTARELVVDTARPHRDGWIIGFVDVDDRNGAEALRGARLTAPPLDRDDAESADDLSVGALIGSVLVDRQGTELGRVVALEANPAHDLLVLDGGALVPMPFVVEQEAGRIVVDLPPGLLEL